MSERDPTCIGRVRHVLGATVTVALDSDLAGVSPIFRGRLQPIGQVGSIVRIPQGVVDLIATVSLVGIAELVGPLQPSTSAEIGKRWLQVQLLGEVDSVGRFHRGVSTYPGLDDSVHFATSDDLRAIYPVEEQLRLRIGQLSAAAEISVTLNVGPLVVRHSAIVGSTGAGKTSAVASLLQRIGQKGWGNANIVVIDPHGEYGKALGEVASLRSVLGEGESLLRVPYWALPAAEILRALAGQVESKTVSDKFAELVKGERQKFVETADWIEMDPSEISPDTPVPFNIRRVWYQLDFDNHATYGQMGGAGEPEVEDDGDVDALGPASFRAYELGGAAPFKGPSHGFYGLVPDRIRQRLLDPRFRFFQEPGPSDVDNDPLVNVIDEWLGRDRPISVLDFSGVPAEVADIAIGVVLQLVFEVAVRSEARGIGRPRPVLIVLEEAHRYLGGGGVAITKEAANRIAREGRKYGVGLMLVTQRPSELPATALSQCGTIIALRLTNSTDQGTVRAALPDAIAGLADVTPSLRTGEAIVSGEGVVLPSRVLIDRPSPEPRAADPSIKPWLGDGQPNELEESLARWRGISKAQESK